MSPTRPDVARAKSDRPLREMRTIAEVMTRSAYTIVSVRPLAHAHDLMRAHGIRHLPVVDDGKLVGVLSQRDLHLVEAVGSGRGQAQTVAQAMTSEPFTVAPGDCVTDVAATMGEAKYGCAVVVDRGHVVGIFTAVDALRLLATGTP